VTTTTLPPRGTGDRVADHSAESTAGERPPVEVFGIRHHGPGSARSLIAALTEYQPDSVLIEGPADADPLLHWVLADGMEPPLALLGYAPDHPQTAAFWPYAVFSPEWQAMSYALRRDIEVGFCDLPASAMLARWSRSRPDDDHEEPDDAADQVPPTAPIEQHDPLAMLAAAAGYDDRRRTEEKRAEALFPLRVTTTAVDSKRDVQAALKLPTPRLAPNERSAQR